VIQTVTGELKPEHLGRCYAHEHVIMDASYATQIFPEQCLNSVENAVKELEMFRDLGGSAMVEATPCGIGRNIRKLVEISQRSGVRIIASTGLHLDKYYSPGHWSRFYSQEELVELFVADIEDGIDFYDYAGPLIKRSTAKAGMIKVASGLNQLTPREREIFRAAAAAHRRTGCPMMTHTEQGTAADEQIYLLKNEGVELSRVMLCHLDRKPDLELHRSLLKKGVTLEYDSAFRWKGREDNPTLELLKVLVHEFPDQLVLGMDAARHAYWKYYGGAPGLGYLLSEFKELMSDAGLGELFIDKLFVKNPARILNFGERISI